MVVLVTGRELYRNHYTTTKTKIIIIIIIKTSTIIAVAISGTEIGVIVEEEEEVVVEEGGITIGMEEIGGTEMGVEIEIATTIERGVGITEITFPTDLPMLTFPRARSILLVALSRGRIREMVVAIVI